VLRKRYLGSGVKLKGFSLKSKYAVYMASLEYIV